MATRLVSAGQFAFRARWGCWLFVAAVLVTGTPATAQLVLTGSLELAEEGGTFDVENLGAASAGTFPFALDELAFMGTIHFIPDINDGVYGNSDSWIGNGDTGTSGAYVGLDLDRSPGELISVASVAFGRDNLGTFQDRTFGLYTLQYTNSEFVDTFTTDAEWTTIGTLDYQGGGGAGFIRPSIRHRYNFDPIEATGLRLIVPGSGLTGGTAIDEFEVYANPGDILIDPNIGPIDFRPGPGFAVSWDGNDGDFNDPAEIALAPDNLALNTFGAVAFGSSEFFGGGIHTIANVNDGRYGNSNSWISDFTIPDSDPFIGIAFDGEIELTSIAWGRDNGNTVTDACSGTCMDRSLGTYELQFTTVSDPDELTTDTGDAATGWESVGEVEYLFQDDDFTPWLRHEFDVSRDGQALSATGLRVKVSNANLAIDEIEVYFMEIVSLFGDTNADGLVNIDDLNNVRNNFGTTGPADGTLDGDAFPFDGLVNIDDLNGVRNNFGAGVAAVPEPSAIILAVVGFALCWTGRGRSPDWGGPMSALGWESKNRHKSPNGVALFGSAGVLRS